MIRAALLLFLACGVAVADWEEAHRRFQAAYTKDVGAAQRKAALLELARADVPEAAELLLNVWETLDQEAVRKRKDLFKVRGKIRDRRDELRQAADPGKRNKLREAITALNDEDVARNVALAVVEIEQDAILQGIAGMKSEATIDWLAQTGMRRARSALLVRTIARKVAESKSGVDTLLVALDRAKAADAIIPLLQALAAHGGKIGPGLPTISKHLTHRDWAVRVAAAHAIARAAQPEGVGALVLAIGREKEGSRARREMARALTWLTGKKFGPDVDQWARWWRDHEADVMGGKLVLGQGRPGAVKGDHGRFYGVPVAPRSIFVLDQSGSMEVSMKDPRWVDGHPVSARDNEDSRFDAALRELRRAAKAQRKGSRYAVILYADHVTPLHEELVDATPKSYADIDQRLNHYGPSGSTNIYEALDFALRVANVHPESPRGAAKADAIFLISDGSPTNSKGETEDPERTLQAVRAWNAHRRVAIHTIGIGKQHNESFLRQLAEENGGEYYAVVPKRKKK